MISVHAAMFFLGITSKTAELIVGLNPAQLLELPTGLRAYSND